MNPGPDPYGREDEPKIPVALARCPGYDHPAALEEALRVVLSKGGFKASPGDRILVKPNLLAPAPPRFLPCTDPAFVAAVCKLLLDLGARVRVGDSPSLGKGREVARRIGLADRLTKLGVRVVELDRPRWAGSGGNRWPPISGQVLESDLVVSLPKFKTHHMSLVTGAVKNLFGCVPGKLKALSHALLGFRAGRFEDMLLDLPGRLPPVFHLLDAVTAMQGRGPVRGEPYPLGLAGGSPSAVALDTALCTILGLNPEEAPLWLRAAQRGIPGSDPSGLCFPLLEPGDFQAPGFDLPASLRRFSFVGSVKKVGGP